VIALYGNKDGCSVADTVLPGDIITLYNVDTELLQSTSEVIPLENAGFTVRTRI
jgi:hypothetical protein